MVKSDIHMLKVSPNEYLPLREVVFKTIRDAIVSGKIVQGERLLEKQLAEQIGVSRTPIREALRKLEVEGFVEMIPRKGAMVSTITEKNIRDVLEVRAVLESLAAKLACENKSEHLIQKLKKLKLEFDKSIEGSDIELMAQRDQAFHDTIFAATGNSKLVHIISNLREQIYRYRVTYLKDETYRKTIAREHDNILNAIENGDVELAQKASTEHVRKQEDAVIRSIK